MTTTYDDLRQRMIDGDSSITAAQLDKARQAAEFEHVQAEAARAATERVAEAERQAAIEQVRADYDEASTSSIEHLRAARRTALDALRDLRHGMVEHNARAFRIQQRVTALGVDGLPVLSRFNVEHEMDRLEREARSDGQVTPPYSRLHDDQAKGSA